MGRSITSTKYLMIMNQIRVQFRSPPHIVVELIEASHHVMEFCLHGNSSATQYKCHVEQTVLVDFLNPYFGMLDFSSYIFQNT